MDFFKLIKSLDELVYEVLSWLLFFPRTLWRILTRPAATMLAAEAELEQAEGDQFNDMIGPPLFLALTLAVIQIVELNLVGQDELVTRKDGFAKFISDDTNLLVLRIVLFGLLPLTVARRLLKVRGQEVEKNGLRAPFYAQCFAAAMYATLFNVGAFVIGSTMEHRLLLGLAIITIAILWFVAVETAWFRVKLACGTGRALWNAVVVFVEWLAVLGLITILIR